MEYGRTHRRTFLCDNFTDAGYLWWAFHTTRTWMALCKVYVKIMSNEMRHMMLTAEHIGIILPIIFQSTSRQAVITGETPVQR